uniref:Uncharacterized protein n=1 Tax=Arundo donax TaxID=35708 RepID=A0A0A9AD28_ARUDO
MVDVNGDKIVGDATKANYTSHPAVSVELTGCFMLVHRSSPSPCIEIPGI